MAAPTTTEPDHMSAIVALLSGTYGTAVVGAVQEGIELQWASSDLADMQRSVDAIHRRLLLRLTEVMVDTGGALGPRLADVQNLLAAMNRLLSA